MDINQAQKIINSAAMTHVNYRGIPVYIQKVHADGNYASVFPLSEMENEQTVELDGLQEGR